MKRRQFIALLGGAITAWPLPARAQQAGGMRRIGVLVAYLENDPDIQTRIAALVQGLQVLGWVDGRNLRITYRYPGTDSARLVAAARELVAMAPDLIVVQSNPAVTALRSVDRTIPAVFVQVGDPVVSGFVESFSRPGGNLTGFATFEPAVGGKWLELLKEVAPAVTRAAFIFDPEIVSNAANLPSAEEAGSIHKIAVSAIGVRDAAEIERALTEFAREPNGGLILVPNPVTGGHRELIAKLALRYRLPSVTAFRPLVASGGLLSYGPDALDLFRRAASYVDRILKGEKPADLPVQGPTKFELVINLKTAKALGLDVSPMLLARADEVIE